MTKLYQRLLVNFFLMLLFIFLARTSDVGNTKQSIYTTCDFDLEGIESMLEHLPAICTEVYDKRLTDPQLYTAYADESKAFAKFYKKLNDYELASSQKQQGVELEQYPFDAEMRRDIYTQVNWADCVVSANATVPEYLSCVTDKRLKLEQLVPTAMTK